MRKADNLLRGILNSVFKRRGLRPSTYMRVEALRQLVREVDVFWVIDIMGLATAVDTARGTKVKVIYEAVDLVAEYHQHGDAYREARLAEERRYLSRVDGFITACDSYADYYWERYGGAELKRRPVVRDNMPAQILDHITPTRTPLRLLFLGSLMYDRPVGELIRAMSLVSSDATLTFQGKNYLPEDPNELVSELGLQNRVRIVPPCPPDDVVEVSAAYDVGIVPLRGLNENERRASTSKLFTFMSAGLAILGTDLPGIARIVSQYDNGVLVDGMEPETWAAAIDGMAAMPADVIDAMKQRSLDAAHNHSWEMQEAVFVGEFARVLGRATTAASSIPAD